jgi:hypothetical protein
METKCAWPILETRAQAGALLRMTKGVVVDGVA